MLAHSRYGQSVRAKLTVSVGRDGRVSQRMERAPMAPHTPLAGPQAHVHTGNGGGACASCGSDPDLVAGNMMGGGPNGEGRQRRRPLGTTRASVTTASTATFSFSTKVPFSVDCFSVPPDISSDFSITSILFGLNQIIVGGAVNATAFSEANKACTGCFDGCVIYPSVPAELIVRNNSLQDLPFEASFWGCALIAAC